jgi:hypothetical protein
MVTTNKKNQQYIMISAYVDMVWELERFLINDSIDFYLKAVGCSHFLN